MNAEQKQRAMQMLRRFSQANPRTLHADNAAVDMAALLHELSDAPKEFESLTRNEDGTVSLKPGFKAVACTDQEALPATNPSQINSSAEPFGYFKAEPFGWTDCAETDDGAIALYTAPSEPKPVARVTGYYAGYLSIATVDGRVLPAGTALYAAPPHQSEHHLEMVNTPAPSVPDGWMRAIDEALVVHHIDIADSSDGYEEAKKKLNELLAINSDIARDCSEPPADVARDAERYRWLLKQAWFQQAADRFDLPDGGLQNRFEKCMDEFIDVAIERQGGE